MRRFVIGPANTRHTTIGGHDQDGRQVVFECAIEKGEAFNVEHVDLVNEEQTRNDVGLAFLAPLGDSLVDLSAHLGRDLASVAAEQGHVALGARVDDVDLVQRDGVNHLFALCQLALGTLDAFINFAQVKLNVPNLNKPNITSRCVEITCTGETATQF